MADLTLFGYIFFGLLALLVAWLVYRALAHWLTIYRRARGASEWGKVHSANQIRTQRFIAIAIALHLLVFAPSLIQLHGCRHDRPLGLPGGSGDKIAKGTPDGGGDGKGKAGATGAQTEVRILPQSIAKAIEQKHLREQRKVALAQQFSKHGLRRILTGRGAGIQLGFQQQLSESLDTVALPGGIGGGTGPRGLPGGVGTGATAAGSPWGSKIGAKLWLYRLKYDSESWDANPKALPVLLQDVHKAIGVEVAGSQEVILMKDLPNHRGDFMPSMLFISGTGRIQVDNADVAGLRGYLLGGGFLIADSSGGDFEQHFKNLMGAVLPGTHFRAVELDHDIYRGALMPYKLPNGCPVYREHGSAEALGLFAPDGRLMVFLSPGDMGSAWAAVDLGRRRRDVEQALQMGSNLVAYSLMTVHDTRKEK